MLANLTIQLRVLRFDSKYVANYLRLAVTCGVSSVGGRDDFRRFRVCENSDYLIYSNDKVVKC